MSLAMRTDMTSAYTAKIPDITTGIKHCDCQRRNKLEDPGKATFMIRSGLYVPTPEIPMPDFAVP